MKMGIGSNIKEGQKCFYNNNNDIVAAECVVMVFFLKGILCV